MTELQATLAFDQVALLAEGPVWNPLNQTLYWVDIQGKYIHIYNPGTRTIRSFPTPGRVGMIVPIENSEELLIALNDGLYYLDSHTGKLRLFISIEKDIPGNRFNDGKCDPSGRLWVGSMDDLELEKTGSLYSIEGNGKVKKHLDQIGVSNGLAWSKDQKTMYYIDSPTRQIKAFDFDISNASLSNPKIVIEFDQQQGFPDGMCIDENDHLWVAMWSGGAVLCIDPKLGQIIGTIKVPALNVTSCAFGGPDLDILYITSARVNTTSSLLEKYPKAGAIFKSVPGVKGKKVSFFTASK